MKKIMVTFAVVSIYLLLLTIFTCTPSQAETEVFHFEQEMTLSDPCAVFNESTDDPNIIRIVYGEPINFDLKSTIQAILDSSDGNVNLKFMINTHGAGIGEDSEIKYQFNSKVLVKANTNEDEDEDGDGDNPSDPSYVFNGKFKLDARIIGQGNDASAGGIAQGAQDNALLHFYITVRYANGEIQSAASDFALECVASPWTNQMRSPQAGTNTPVGRGFGDPWNKYSWSMKDFNGGMVVGTKNAYFDYDALLNPSTDVQTCINTYPLPSIYSGLACLELYGAGTSAQTHYAEIWRFDYVKKNWTKVRDDIASQGFRIMETHNGKLYVGSDLGSFVTGVDLLGGPPWNFPGSQILRSTDGKNFDETFTCPAPPYGPCSSASGSPPVNANVSIRALASFNGMLYVGTFNFTGGELWSYDDTSDTWALIHKFGLTKPAVTELRVFNDKLYIGLGGVPDSDYLWSYDGISTSTPAVVDDLPPIGSDTNIGVLKLFVSSNDLLYIGLVDLESGFTLLSYATDLHFETITNNGFYNSNNAYAWSMAELNGRVFVGTFNKDFFTELPRGSAELWYSDDGTNWQQMALPLDWGLWNYGIRTMEVGNKQLFLGTASNMVAPDLTLISTLVPLSPGTEVWTIRTTAAVAPKDKSGK